MASPQRQPAADNAGTLVDVQPSVRFLTRWYVATWLWLLFLAANATLILLRLIRTSAFGQMLDHQEASELFTLYENYHYAYFVMLLLGVTGVAVFWLLTRPSFARGLGGRSSDDKKKLRLLTAHAAIVVISAYASLYGGIDPANGVRILRAPGFAEWLTAGLVLWAALTNIPIIGGRPGKESASTTIDKSLSPNGRPNNVRLKLAVVYLFGLGAVQTYALYDHISFWNPAWNGGYDRIRFFVNDGEAAQAALVLFSTSFLFAALTAMVMCGGYLLCRRMGRGRKEYDPLGPSEYRGFALLTAGAWAISLIVPWMARVMPEIRTESAWYLPPLLVASLFAGFLPLALVTVRLLQQDFSGGGGRTPGQLPRRESAYLTFMLFLAYPLLRLTQGRAAAWALAVAAVLGGGSITSMLLNGSLGWGAVAVLGICAAVSILCAVRMIVWPGAAHRCHVLLCWTVAGLAAGIVLSNFWSVIVSATDWRDMMRKGQLPYMRIFLALCGAWLTYVLGHRAIAWMRRRRDHPREESVAVDQTAATAYAYGTANGNGRTNSKAGAWGWRVGRWALYTVTIVTLLLASFPFWGWGAINENAFARVGEFSARHEFELGTLQWVLDFDRDGYAALLHGSDPDDFDPSVMGAGIHALGEVAFPVDQFEIADAERARAAPSVLMLFLEGVTPRSITAYGERTLTGGRSATPAIDAIAAEGVRFTNARACYPCTWDAWCMINTGRFMRVMEPDGTRPFKDRYTRFNNINKTLKLVGLDRTCHADACMYKEMLVAEEDRRVDWETDFDAQPNDEESARDVWFGDKRKDRIVRFIQSLKPGERFLVTEHMADSHFVGGGQWCRTQKERAQELGFPDGLEFAEEGGRTTTEQAYYQNVARCDGQIRDIIAALKAAGRYDDTLIVIISDHGCQFWEHDHLTYPGQLYEQAIHIPFFIRLPTAMQVPRNIVVHDPVIQMDVLPTIMELCGVRHANPDPAYPMPGKSLVPLMTGTATSDQRAAYADRDLILTTHYDMLGYIRRFQYKLITDRPLGTYLLFDLVNDPGETCNLADSDPALLESMLVGLQGMAKKHEVFLGGIKR